MIHTPRIRHSILYAALAAASLIQGSVAQAEKVLLPNDSLTAGLPGTGAVSTGDIEKWLAEPKNHEKLEVELPAGLSLGQSTIVGLDKNPLTRAKIELGRQLYFDTRLSSDNTISCASCHHPDEGFGKHTKFGVGVGGQMGGRNSPISYNRILSSLQFWDGRAESLEAQAVGPIQNPIEMGNTHESCVACLQGIPGYTKQFKAIFGADTITIDHVGQAIASFERVLVTGTSPFDYAEALRPFKALTAEDLADLQADDKASYAKYEAAVSGAKAHPMSDSASRGRELFFSERVGCATCHVGANLADEKYHNLGIGMDAKEPDLGRFVVTKVEAEKGAFKTPTIRNVEHSAPYMHDGSLTTLLEVVEHYNKGGTPNKWLSDKIKPLKLTDQEKTDLVEFMKACSGPFPKVQAGRLPADK
jgi:cytochrome c peroxidase